MLISINEKQFQDILFPLSYTHKMAKKKQSKIFSKEERQDTSRKENERIRLFEVYMIEIGQWRRNGNQIEQTIWEYKTALQIEDGFRSWLKKNNK